MLRDVPDDLLEAARHGDDAAAWSLRERLVTAMVEAAARNGHVRSQLARLGFGHSVSKGYADQETLPDLLSLTDLGARLVDRIAEVGWHPQHLEKVLLLETEGVPCEVAIARVARWTLRHIADQEDSLVVVRKAIERGVRLASRAGAIEEIIAVGFRQSERVNTFVEQAVGLHLIGRPFRTVRLRETLIVFTRSAKTSSGRRFNIIFRRPFIGAPGVVSEFIRQASDPWRALTTAGKRKAEVQELARCKIRPLVPKRRKGRGTISEILAIPLAEVKRIAEQLAGLAGGPLERAVFLSGVYATLSECNIETLSRLHDPTNPFAPRFEGADENDRHEMDS
jgi:hypothetical protein